MYWVMAVIVGLIFFWLTLFTARDVYLDQLKCGEAAAKDQSGGILISGTIVSVLAGFFWPAVLVYGILAGLVYGTWYLFLKWVKSGK